jgi:hypothetical protein
MKPAVILKRWSIEFCFENIKQANAAIHAIAGQQDSPQLTACSLAKCG